MRARLLAVLDRLRLRAPLQRMRQRARNARERIRVWGWKASVLCLSRTGVRLRTLAGAGVPDEVLVVICLWSRPHRLRLAIDALAAQVGSPPIRLVFWNNNPCHHDTYRAEIARRGDLGALSRIELGSSRINLGGMARFLVARSVTTAASPQQFIMIDDDQNVAPEFVADTLRVAGPRVYAGVWAFRLGVGYWDRVDIAPGDSATYVGTGGSVCDSSLVHQKRFFSGLPAKYGFVEDLWASSFAYERGWTLAKTNATLEFVDDDVNQYPKMVWLKAEFFEYLRDHHGYARG